MKRKAATPKERFFARIDEFVQKDQWKEIGEESAARFEEDESWHECLFLMAAAATVRQDFAAAVANAKQACDADPKVIEYCDLLATLYAMAGDINGGVFFAKMASVGTSSPRLADWRPKSLPTFTEAFFEARTTPFLQRGTVALTSGKWGDAEHWFSQHLAFHPRDVEAYVGLANSLMVRGLYAAAAESLRAARHAVPEDARLVSLLGSALAGLGQFAESRFMHRRAKEAGADNPAVHAAPIDDLLLDPECAPAEIAAEASEWAERFAVAPDAVVARRKGQRAPRLTVGYVVGSLSRQGKSNALTDILARHDGQRFRVVGFGAGALSDPINMVFQKCFEAWTDTQDTDPLTFSSMVLAEDVDVLVDVGGFSTPKLLRAFGARLAPVQALWSPTIYGMAPRNVDVLLTDGYLDPADRPSEIPGERIWRLEKGCPLVEQPTLPEPTDASAHAERGPTFAADALLSEINLPTVEAWAAILAAVPEATLLLRDHEFRTEDVSKRLIGLFGNFGVAHRIDIVATSSAAELFAQADVCLLPYQSMRPEIVVEALAAGLPAVAWSGAGRHRRILGSVLHFAGMAGDMVAESRDAYRDKALAWMGDPTRRAAFREGGRERLTKAPIFDAAGRAADLETAYRELHEKALARVELV